MPSRLKRLQQIKPNSGSLIQRGYNPLSVARIRCSWLLLRRLLIVGFLIVPNAAWSLTLEQAEFGTLSENPHSINHDGYSSISQIQEWQTRTLPDYWDIHGPYDGGQGWYKIRFNLDETELHSIEEWAIYIPKHSRTLEIYLNNRKLGKTGSFTPRLSNNWLHPYLFSIPDDLLVAGENQLYLRMAGYDYNSMLSKIYLNEESILEESHHWRSFFHIDIAQVSFVLMLFLAGCMAVFWLFRRKDSFYLCISMFCLTSAFYVCDQFVKDFPFDLSSNIYSLLFSAGISLNCFFVVLFIHRFLNVTGHVSEVSYLLTIVVCYTAGLVLGSQYVFWTSTLIHLVDGGFGFYVLFTLFKYRHKIHTIDSNIVLFLYSLSYALSIHDFVARTMEPPYTDITFLQWTPLIMSLSIFWLVFSRLLRTLDNFERLNDQLHVRVAEKSEQVMLLEKKQAIAEERQRIMYDLHDGIGSHLVHALNYLKRAKIDDKVLTPTLSRAMQELRLMIDTMGDSDRSIAALLGVFRERFEPLLTAQNIELEWRVDDCPDTELSPSEALDFLRILQETMTNIIKHAEAERVILATTATSIEVQDYGKGMDVVTTPGLGIKSMQARAIKIGARFDISSNEHGTRVLIEMP